MGVSDADLREDYLFFLDRMDIAYLAHHAEEQKRKAKTKPAHTPASRRPRK